MKNIDVPMWDKGDSTDNFAKGGGSRSSFFSDSSSDKTDEIKSVYQLVLGRDPSSREISFYRYSLVEKEKIVEKLLKSDEHKEILKKAQEYPTLTERNKLAENSILKLKSYIKDQESEHSELQRLLVEKNSLIEGLRETKVEPFLTDSKLLEVSNSHYSVSKSAYQSTLEQNDQEKRVSFFEKVLRLFFEK